MFDRRAHGEHAEVELAIDVTVELRNALAKHGSEAGHYNVLGPDPWRVIWNHDRSGFISFLEARHCVLTWRSPVASRSDYEHLLASLLNHARATRRQLFCVPVNEDVTAVARDLGMSATWMGTECFVDLASWNLEGGRREKLRLAQNHGRRLGLTWREARPLESEIDFTGLARVEEAWKQERRERRTDSFLRTSFTELAHLRRFFVCEESGEVVASTTCTPINSRGWYLQDLVRTPHAPRGALEGTLILALDTLRDEGYTTASNGPLAFWHPSEGQTDNHPLGPVANRVIAYFDRRYRFQNINQFRSKVAADSLRATYLLRSDRMVTPRVVRSLVQLLTRATTP